MTSNNSPVRPSLAKALPVAVTILVWFFAATAETAYVAVLNTGIQQSARTTI